MSIASEITRINNNISAAYTKVSDKGGTLPATQNSANLATAIDSISTGGSANITSLSVTPSTSQQVITASGNVDGYSPITVSAVTSSIDANITAGNIKDGVSILGVTGNYTGSGGVVVDHRTVENGVYMRPSQSYTYTCPSSVTDVGDYGFGYSFYRDENVISADFSSLQTASGAYAFSNCFNNCTSLTSVDFSSLQTASGTCAFSSCFSSCTSLTSVDFSSLQTASGERALGTCFSNCTSLTSVDFSSLQTVSGYRAFYCTVQNVSNLTSADFSSLQTISGSQAFYSCFSGCTSLRTISFPKLTSITSSEALKNCFNNCNNLTAIHFRQDAQSIVEALTDYSSKFGATNATIYFDLTD